jgi:hypothetical protein
MFIGQVDSRQRRGGGEGPKCRSLSTFGAVGDIGWEVL